MARGMNHVFLVGSLARDPEITYTSQGVAILNLTVAGEDTVIGTEGTPKSLPWYHRVSVLGKPAEAMIEQINAGSLRAGTAVMVVGSLDYRTWEDQGQKRSMVNVKASRVDVINRSEGDLVQDSGGGFRLTGGLNQVVLVGNLGREVEFRNLPSGDRVASFSIAISESWMDRTNTRQEKTHWIELTLWREHANFAESLKKGDGVMVTGRLRNESWTDREGQKRNSLKVEATHVEALTRGPAPAQGLVGTAPQTSRQAYGTGANTKGSHSRGLDIDEGLSQNLPPEEDDLPF